MEGSAAMSDEIPDLLYSDAERALSDALASLLADRGGLDKALARVESAQTYDDKLWQAVAADLGCAGLLIPERDGGAGASYREPADAGTGVVRLRGMVSGVADALPASVLLVPADGVPHGLYLVDVGAEGVAKAPVTSLDMTRQLCDLSFDDAPATLIASGPGAERAVDAAMAAGAGILAAEQTGLAQRCLDMTIAYVKERKQFARPVGSFQALKHRLADLWVSVTQARAASRYAAACLATGSPDAKVAVALAKAYCSDVAVIAAQECVQMHGGIGFTWEHPAHLYLKRAKADSIGFGTADANRAALASLVDLPAS